MPRNIIDETVLFHGCRIQKDAERFVTLDMQQYLSGLTYLYIQKGNRNDFELPVTTFEVKE